jgi:hypothetical protein
VVVLLSSRFSEVTFSLEPERSAMIEILHSNAVIS